MKSSKNAEKLEFASGCPLCFFALVFFVSFAVFTINRYKNESHENLIAANKELLSQKFEVKEIFLQIYGNKRANRCVSHQCIVQNIETKLRLTARFNERNPPVVGDLWKLQIVQRGPLSDRKHVLYEKVE